MLLAGSAICCAPWTEITCAVVRERRMCREEKRSCALLTGILCAANTVFVGQGQIVRGTDNNCNDDGDDDNDDDDDDNDNSNDNSNDNRLVGQDSLG